MTITVSKQEFCEQVATLLTMLERGVEIVVQRPGQTELKVTAGQPPSEGEKPRREWKFNLHPGAWTVRDDFDDPIDEFSVDSTSEFKAKRIPGLFAGQGWMSDDFDAPLPPEYLPSEE